MKSSPSIATLDPSQAVRRVPRPTLLQRAVLRGFEAIEAGRLEVVIGERRHRFGQEVEGAADAVLEVHDERFWGALALRGSIGAGEAYALGWWDSPAATDLVRLMVRNQDALDRLDSGWARLSKPFLAAFHRLRRNTEEGSRDNIAAHYDLSNDFFELFLDPTMTYSSGVFEHGASSLEEASVAKIDRLCRKLELGPDDHLLEIGTGWGGLALHAAREYGCRVTTTTISRQQHAYATRRIEEAGLSGRVTLLLEDYRKLTGTYDKLVSVEMIEAVGHQYYGEFFAQCGRLLKPHGMMAMQAILIADQHFERAARSVDFIQRYIFPGSNIPSTTALLSAATGSSDLRLSHHECFGTHYTRTLAAWRERLRTRWEEAQALGFEETFLRLFEFYFHYCEGGFEERHIDVAQLTLVKPGARSAPMLGSLAR
ncbi:MAG: cyclopropane-fatty-acyl-phospholipid synthase [Planctomycetota bacterium]|nr:cyclopropane-fatty-acyl-phospholipid synthase [Planctomycetota bacterium]